MCGIAGYINLKSEPVRNTSAINSMLKVQKHRGPDDSGIMAFSLVSGKSITLNTSDSEYIANDFEGIVGFNRLSILDLSLNGHQPMASPDGKVILMLNGEIYNAFDFKPELVSDGYKFRSTTDTEVVLALYLKYGFDKTIDQLNGMFAIVIIDLHQKVVFITRDRFGIKPIYYIFNNNLLAFSSEIKSFQFLQNFRFELNPQQLDEYLLFRNNIYGTLFQDISLLEPGSSLLYRHDYKLVQRRFFNVDSFERIEQDQKHQDYYQTLLEDCLSKSVKSQLMSDVKLGCQLSGGVDSSIVTYYASKSAERGFFESISIVFDDEKYSEEKYIEKVANQLNIESHKFILKPEYYLDNIESATWHFEMPLNHPNTIGIYLLSQKAKHYVTVLLSGEGADEIFGGYRRYYDTCFPFLNTLFAEKIKYGFSEPKVFFDYFSQSSRAIMASAFILPTHARLLYPSFEIGDAIKTRDKIYNNLTGSAFTRQVKYEILTYLPDLLIRQDKMSMAHSIENRVPFLDNHVVECSFNVPQRLLVKRISQNGVNTEKYLLKSTAAKMFGSDFAFRGKMGFGIPIRNFISNEKFHNYLKEKIIPGMRRRGILNTTWVENCLDRISTASYYEVESLWIAVTFEIWASTFLDSHK